MRDEFEPVLAGRFTVLDDVAIPDTWSLVLHKLLDPTSDDPIDAAATIELEPQNPIKQLRVHRRWMLAAAAVVLVVAAAILLVGRDPRESADMAASPPSDATTPAVGSSFAAAIEASGVLTIPSAEEVAQASNTSDFQPISGPTQVWAAAGNFVSLHTCRPSPNNPSTCSPTQWAYTTGSVDGGVVHRGLLGEADRPELYVLDDRFVVALEISPGSRLSPKAWLIDSVSGGHAELTWRGEPTTITSDEQALVIFDDPSPVTNLWAEVPIERFLPRVVDARDGTIRPLSVPDEALADLSVAQSGTGRIWTGTSPDGRDLGVAYSDDGGATWAEVTLPAQLASDATDVATAASYGDTELSIAADGDHIAITDTWVSSASDRDVYISTDAGLSWSTATVDNPVSSNGLRLYPLDDKRLLLVQSLDAYPTQLLVSAGSDWTKLDRDPQASRTTARKLFSVNRAGTFYSLETDTNTGHPSSTTFSADLTNWRTIPVVSD
jgi:hypothetical protein